MTDNIREIAQKEIESIRQSARQEVPQHPNKALSEQLIEARVITKLVEQVYIDQRVVGDSTVSVLRNIQKATDLIRIILILWGIGVIIEFVLGFVF